MALIRCLQQFAIVLRLTHFKIELQRWKEGRIAKLPKNLQSKRTTEHGEIWADDVTGYTSCSRESFKNFVTKKYSNQGGSRRLGSPLRDRQCTGISTRHSDHYVSCNMLQMDSYSAAVGHPVERGVWMSSTVRWPQLSTSCECDNKDRLLDYYQVDTTDGGEMARPGILIASCCAWRQGQRKNPPKQGPRAENVGMTTTSQMAPNAWGQHISIPKTRALAFKMAAGAGIIPPSHTLTKQGFRTCSTTKYLHTN
jgi:hypothetical protein